MKPRRNSRATVIFAGSIAALLSSHSAQAGDADNYTGPDAGSLLTTSSWSLEAVPTIANDAVFISESGIRKLTAKNLTVNSFNVTASSGTYSIRNETTTSTNSILTLGGAGSSSNLTAGAAAGDLIYVASGNTFNLRGDNSKGTGVLQVNLGQSGNFNIAGSSEISAAIGESGSSSGSTLSYSAVPEPTSALVGLLIAAGLLRRRWDSNEVSQNQAALAERGNLSGWDATPFLLSQRQAQMPLPKKQISSSA